MRSRWAAALALLASVLLLTLCPPVPADGRPAAVRPAAAQYDEPAGAVPEAAGHPLPGEDDAPRHRPVARPPRASGTAGPVLPAAGAASATAERRRPAPRPYPAGPPRECGPDGPAPGAARLQTFRC
ncbi:hypothetical protein ACH4CD_09460 [Streptomyces fungicidicus]|uniref:hypothetical protein n=1 Tax=Streptomyces fungicidicus TaxID=68203 RepID=UPI0037A2F2E4